MGKKYCIVPEWAEYHRFPEKETLSINQLTNVSEKIKRDKTELMKKKVLVHDLKELRRKEQEEIGRKNRKKTPNIGRKH